MIPARTAFAALLVWLSVPAAAQDPSGSSPRGLTAADQAYPNPRDPIARPKRGRLIDLIKTVVPPLIEAASSRPPPPREPVSAPIVPAAAPPPVPQIVPAIALSPAGIGAVVVPPPPSRPVETQPRPAAPRPLPAAVAIPQAPPAARPAPKPPATPPAETLAPLAPTTAPPPAAPPFADLSPPPATIVRAETPPAAAEPETPASWWSGLTVPLLAILAAIFVLAGAHRLRRMRRIARTRAALALSPRLDPVAGASSISGLSLVAPPLSIRMRLTPAAYG